MFMLKVSATDMASWKAGVGLHDVLQQLTGGRLTTFSHPVVGNEDITVRSPDTIHEDRLLTHRQVAGGSTGDSCKTGKCLADVVLGLGLINAVAAKLDLGTDCANPACVSINDTAAHSDTGGKSEIVRGLLRECGNLLASSVELVVLRAFVNKIVPMCKVDDIRLTKPLIPPRRLQSSFVRSSRPISLRKSSCQPFSLPSTPTGTYPCLQTVEQKLRASCPVAILVRASPKS